MQLGGHYILGKQTIFRHVRCIRGISSERPGRGGIWERHGVPVAVNGGRKERDLLPRVSMLYENAVTLHLSVHAGRQSDGTGLQMLHPVASPVEHTLTRAD